MCDLSSSFPALIVMGPPHSGKSVLAYLLTQALWHRQVAHFLLRTAPDGEGNWFYEGAASTTRLLRLSAKGRYTQNLVHRMLGIIHHRHLPLLVDIGGRPQGKQWEILEACTHGILLYRKPDDLDFWMPKIRHARLELLAVLESRRGTQDVLKKTSPYLEGIISGLERQNPQPGKVLEALIPRIQERFTFSEADLEALHRKTAPYEMVSEAQIARELGKRKAPPWWLPEDLPRLILHLPQRAIALYGRGPTWLAAAVAASHTSWPLALFDGHFGWIEVPKVTPDATMPLRWEVLPLSDGWFFAIARLQNPFLEYGDVPSPSLPEDAQGVILYGKLPRWIYASLARHFSRRGLQVAVWEPRREGAIGVTAQVLGRILSLQATIDRLHARETHIPHPGV